mmetsp:Transcript_94556/g.138061  ORF Transcript_94556/g.138061 Transcript_94556/m.138061 type:complete len:236 (-) Transcript_94556:523-1230(-)
MVRGFLFAHHTLTVNLLHQPLAFPRIARPYCRLLLFVLRLGCSSRRRFVLFNFVLDLADDLVSLHGLFLVSLRCGVLLVGLFERLLHNLDLRARLDLFAVPLLCKRHGILRDAFCRLCDLDALALQARVALGASKLGISSLFLQLLEQHSILSHALLCLLGMFHQIVNLCAQLLARGVLREKRDLLGHRHLVAAILFVVVLSEPLCQQHRMLLRHKLSASSLAIIPQLLCLGAHF